MGMSVPLNQTDCKLLPVLFISLCLSSPPPNSLSSPSLSSPLSCSCLWTFFCFLTCISSHQPLPVSAAGIGEGERTASGADGALLQGAAGTSRLWKHQECCHTRTNVRQPHYLLYLRDLFPMFSVMHLLLFCFYQPELKVSSLGSDAAFSAFH